MGRRTSGRAARGERRRLIVEGALKVLSEQGLSASTRDIARALGVTQALLYKYFPSKEALIDAVFEARYATEHFLPDPELLTLSREPLAERVAAFYNAVFDFLRDGSMKLFLRAAIDGYPAADIYARTLARGSIIPLIAALRAELGLPGLEERPACDAEYEIAMAQHGGVVFIAIRNLVYERGPRTPVREAIERHSRIWAAGALSEMTRIHEQWSEQRRLPDRLFPDGAPARPD